MQFRFLKTALLTLALTLPLAAQASVTLTLTPASQPLLPGGTVLFSGTISNSFGSAEVFLNALNINLTGLSNTFLVADPAPFFAGAPLSLLGGDSYTGGLFNITMAGGAPGGTYFGIAELLGGRNGSRSQSPRLGTVLGGELAGSHCTGARDTEPLSPRHCGRAGAAPTRLKKTCGSPAVRGSHSQSLGTKNH